MVRGAEVTGVFGVDEAGKGPVLGSMFAAAVSIPDESVLPAGIDDSKNLSPERRAALAAALRADDRIAVGIAEIAPDRIDAPETDMNSLTVAAQATAIGRAASAGERGIADAGDVDADRFARRVTERVPAAVTVAAEHGADETHPVVGAASVLAKVERDAHVARLAEEYGDVGSGYPSDPTTREFLRWYVDEHGDLPPCARRSWSTAEDVLAAADQSSLDQF